MSSIKKSNSKPRPVYQLRRQSLLQHHDRHHYEEQQDTVSTRSQRHLQEISPAAAAVAASTHIPSVDDVTNMCKAMMHLGHLSKEIVIPKGLDLDADEDDEMHVSSAKQQPTSTERPLRRRSNSFDKLIKAFRLQDELSDDDEGEDDAEKKQESLNFEPVHVPPPRHLNRHHHDKPDGTKANHLHEAMLLSLVAKSAKSSEQSAPPAAAFHHANPFDSADVFEKLHASSSSMDSLCLDGLATMAKMDIVQRETEREIRAHLDEERRCHAKGSQRHLHNNGRDEHETAALRATLQAYASHHASSTSCTIESISLTEFDGLIVPKSEVPIEVSSEHNRLWRPRHPSLHRKVSATTA